MKMNGFKNVKKALSWIIIFTLMFSLIGPGFIAVTAAQEESAAEPTATVMAPMGEELAAEEPPAAPPVNVEEPGPMPEPEVTQEPGPTLEPGVVGDIISFNTDLIEGNATANGVEVFVSAPAGSFYEGTTVTVTLLNETETNVAFNISFTDISGARVQPEIGKEVTLRFTVEEGSPLLSGEDKDTKLSVYHINEYGNYEEMESVVTSSGAVEIEIKATHFPDFSEYGLVSEEFSAEENPEQLLRGGAGTRAVSSSNLSDFLTNVVIDAPTDGSGSYIINPNNSYQMTLSFRENENLQFTDEAVLTYDFPAGVLMNNVNPTVFDINIVDEIGSATIHGNTFEVVNGQLRVSFNQSDPNFDRLKALSNVRFNISLSSKFDQNVGEIVFNANVIKDFVFEENADLGITKSVIYDKNTDTANYVITVTSTGTNENVVI